MMITSIKEYRRGKRLICLNDEPAFVLYPKEVKYYSLVEGEELSDESFELIKEELLLKRCKSRMLHLIDKVDKTESEIRDKLKDEMYPPDVIDKALEAAKKGRYVDDERYAHQYVYEKTKGKSRRMVSYQLAGKGVPEELIQKALEDIPDNEEELIKKQILKKHLHLSELTYEDRQKLLSGLCRKGFDTDKCIRVLRELTASEIS
ncbi:MAG: recombination regulator RecX [Lachnospiraceae bacterium]|nr:recombination regulator RecX [Lachnospiraceae bacterium]